jgi:hypothetical protein
LNPDSEYDFKVGLATATYVSNPPSNENEIIWSAETSIIVAQSIDIMDYVSETKILPEIQNNINKNVSISRNHHSCIYKNVQSNYVLIDIT